VNIREDDQRKALIRVLEKAKTPLIVQQPTLRGDITVFGNVGGKESITRIDPDGTVRWR
jgi:hypothetical protein